MNRKHSIKKLFSLILIGGSFILIAAGICRRVNSQIRTEEYFQTEVTPTPSEADKRTVIIKKFLKLFLIMSSDTDSDSSSPPGSITGSPTVPTPDSKPAFASLRAIFETVGAEIEVPPLILEAVMSIETPSTFNLTPEQVEEYSTPGNTIPGCGPNVCSATGPMQMTTGKDNNGNSLCPNCCWKGVCRDSRGGCPNAWATYGTGLPCNITDNVRAAAKKLKKDSGSTSSVNWTQHQVYEASRKYHGNCTVAYPRLGNRTYCEYVWWYYTIDQKLKKVKN